MRSLSNSLRTTWKQIRRSGWLGWASIAVMTLAAFVSTVFGGLFFTATLFLQKVEQEPQIYAVFEIGAPESEILALSEQWSKIPGVAYIEYTSEEQAKQEFYNLQKGINDLAAKAVEGRQLPAILAIRVNSLDFAGAVNDEVVRAKDNNPIVTDVRYSSDIVDNIREVFGLLRLGGGIIMAMLFIVIILFTLLTVEFRMHSQAEEIEIMQLVGGSLGYIRLPFILEGGFYGFFGALISNIIIAIMAALVWREYSSGRLSYLHDLLSGLGWPSLNIANLGLLFIGILVVASILGAINSFIAIRRYIK